MRATALFFLVLALLFPAGHAHATALPASVQQDVTKATLVSEYAGITPGKPLHTGVILELKEGWHTYWENPGDAGMPTTLTWTLPPGFSASAIDWPAPERVPEGMLVTHSYHGTLFLPVVITPPATLEKNTSHILQVKASWLVCKDICIPESAEMAITLPVSDSPHPLTEHFSLFERHREQAVQRFADPIPYTIDVQHITLSIPLASFKPAAVTSAIFFPRQPNMVDYAADQVISIEKDILYLQLRRMTDVPVTSSSGVLTLITSDRQVGHFDITLSPALTDKPAAVSVAPAKKPLIATETQTSAPAPAPSTPSSLGPPPAQSSGSPLGLATIMLLAVAGGLILNLMPCVLPVLSLKTLAIVREAGESPARVRKAGIAYTLGILFSFALIAGTLIALRETGEAIGWGYQMQSPGFVGFLIYLLFLVGLNLSGFFDLPVVFGNTATRISGSSAGGSFYTGMLATAVATPCTAPFMASAVGAALTMPVLESMLVFQALGLGLALPFLLVSIFPALLRFLPKPGAWMERLKQFLAFPMYASVIWLIWVLTLQTGASGAVIALSGMLIMVMVIWMRGVFKPESILYRLLALLAFMAVLFASLPVLEHMGGAKAMPAAEKTFDAKAVPFSKAALEELRASGKPVFLNATAAWCITCQFNGRVAIYTERTMKLFKEKDITLMVADWTSRDKEITDLLSSFGHKGVPLYVYYPPGKGTPEILPQILTEDIIRNTITP